LEEELLARQLQLLQGVAEIEVRAVLVGEVEVADAAVVGVADQFDETGLAELDLVGRVANAGRAGAHAEQRRFQAGLAEGDEVGPAAEAGRCPGGVAEESGGSADGGRRAKEVTA